jgi:HSP20 family protein
MTNLSSKKPVSAAPLHHKNPFLVLQNELENAINSFYNFTGLSRTSFGNFENLALNPSVDIVDDKENFKIEAEMPGMGEENIKVSISDGMLTIKGEKEISKKDEGKNYIKREINYGCYERTIALPDSVDVDKAEASFKKGMLWINIPKKAEAIKKSRELKVEKAAE